MASSEPSRRWFSSVRSIVSEKVGEFCHSLGVSEQEEAEKCGDETSAPTSEMAASGRKTRSAAKKESEPPALMSQHHSMEPLLQDSMVDTELMDTQVKTLLTANGELNTKLQERDRQIIALQQEASVIARKNQDLKAQLSKSKHKDLLEQIKEKELKLQESEGYVRKQSVLIATLKDEQLSTQSENIAKNHELEDELAKVKDDFESARYSLEQEKADKKILLAKLSRLQDELATVKEDFESAQYSLEQGKAEKKKLLAKLSTYTGPQTLQDSDECFNQVCVEKQLLLSKLLTEEESSKIKISSLQKLVGHLKETYNEMLKERDEARTDCAVAKAKADIFKADFEEERKDREKAQGALEAFTNKKNYTTIMKERTAELRQDVAAQKDLVKQQKIEIAKLKSKLQSSKEVVDGMIFKIEEQSREIEDYKTKAAKIPQLEVHVRNFKKSMKDVQSKLEKKVSELSGAQKECEKLRIQVSHGTSVQVKLADSLDKVEKSLADSNKEVQELKRSNRKLEGLVKKKEKSQVQQYSADTPDDSSFEKLYDDELEQNLELKNEISLLKGRIEDLSKEVQRRRQVIHMIKEHKVKVDQETQTLAEQPPFQQMQTEMTKSTTENTFQQGHIYEPIPADSGQKASESNAVHSALVPQNTLPLPPKGLGGKARAQSDIVCGKGGMTVYDTSHEALHNSLQNREYRKPKHVEHDNAETTSITSGSAIPVGKDGNPLRAGGTSRNNVDTVSTMPKGKDGYPLRAGGVASRSRVEEARQSEHENSREAPKPLLNRSGSADYKLGIESFGKENCGHGIYSNSHQEESSIDQHEHPPTWNQPHRKNIPDSQPLSGPYSYPTSTSSSRLRANLQNSESSSPTMFGGLNTESRSGDFKSQQYYNHESVDVRDTSHGVGKNYSYQNEQMSKPPDYYSGRRDQQYYQCSEAEASGGQKSEMTNRADCRDKRDKQQFPHTGADAAYMHETEMTKGEYQRGKKDQHDMEAVAYRREGKIIDQVDRHSSQRNHQQYPNRECDAACLPDVQGNVQQYSNQSNYSGKSDDMSIRELGSDDGSHISYPTLNSESVNENESHRFNSDIPGQSQDLSGCQFQEHAAALHAGTSDPSGTKSEQSNSYEQISQSNQDENACLSSTVDSNNQTKPIPKPRQHFSSEEVPSTLKKDDSEDESLHHGIDQDIEVVAKGVENEVNRDPSLEITVNEKPYDPNLVCPICGRKFRIGEIQKFRKHVDACV